MKDVAALAGVSLSTVSRVVNDAPVDPALAGRVRDAVGRLGYRRDAAAAGLRRSDRASASVGLIVDDVANPFFSAVHRGLEDVARSRGVLIFAGSSDDRAGQERELASSFSSHGVDGLVIVPAGDDHRYLERERDAGVPVVFLDRPPRRFVADTVLSDNAGGMRAAAEHLVAAGHSRIAFLGDRARVWTAGERLAACRGIVAPDLVRMNLTDSGAAADAVRELLDDPDPPTALLCGQNRITVGVLYALRELGLQDRIAVVGFDDVPLGALVNVTVVAQDPVALGRHAAELLFARLEGDDSPPREVVVPTRLIARGSGEISPVAPRSRQSA